ncbi:hypothetical protein EQG68_12740 [Flavobacterium piscinae]|uniref:Uncharacterized protein n=1 Tax=Flavobacterium piscinae TaxID=2506424 RepID=A0A4Q1KJ85_9FLAO|nr:hypothetical protein [Flavobacterium piscinae]RXR29727.1 hypothetical protein EQG68_12740 [Flavobacterium piscinae]
MAILIKVFKNNLFVIFFLISSILTCKNFGFVLSSVYDNEEIFLRINDSIILNNVKINTDRALGIDVKNQFSFDASSVELKIETKGTIEVIDKQFTRVLKKDTLLYIKNGKYIWIEVIDNEINIKQRKRKFVLE